MYLYCCLRAGIQMQILSCKTLFFSLWGLLYYQALVAEAIFFCSLGPTKAFIICCQIWKRIKMINSWARIALVSRSKVDFRGEMMKWTVLFSMQLGSRLWKVFRDWCIQDHWALKWGSIKRLIPEVNIGPWSEHLSLGLRPGHCKYWFHLK